VQLLQQHQEGLAMWDPDTILSLAVLDVILLTLT